MERIAVGFDGSPDADAALAWAMTEERLGDAALTAVLAWTRDECPPVVRDLAGPDASPEAIDAAARTILEQAVARHPDANHQAHVTPRPVEKDPADALEAIMPHVDLIVLGRHGSPRRRHAFSGSVTADCLHHATVPVVVVSAGQPRTDDHRPIVVGVDGSPTSLDALRWGAAAARRRSAPLVALRAWMPVMATYSGFYAPYYADGDIGTGEKIARELLDDAVERALPGNKPGTGPLDLECRVVEGRATASLLAESANAQLIVVGSRGLGGFGRLLLGSTAHQCVQHSQCPVVVMRDHSGPGSTR